MAVCHGIGKRALIEHPFFEQDVPPAPLVLVKLEDVGVSELSEVDFAPAAATTATSDHDPAAVCTGSTDHDYAVIQLHEPYDTTRADNWESLTVRTLASNVTMSAVCALVFIYLHSSIIDCCLWAVDCQAAGLGRA